MYMHDTYVYMIYIYYICGTHIDKMPQVAIAIVQAMHSVY